MKPQILVWLCIAGGGSVGALGRYLLGAWIQTRSPGEFPAATLLVNVLGCLLFGLLYSWMGITATQQLRGFLFTGLLGGFTTFSTFGFETVSLLQRGHQGLAIGYVASSFALGLVAVWLGLTLGGLTKAE